MASLAGAPGCRPFFVDMWSPIGYLLHQLHFWYHLLMSSKQATNDRSTDEDRESVRAWIFSRKAWRNTPSNMMGSTGIKRGALLKANLDAFNDVVKTKETRKETFQEAVSRKQLSGDQLQLQRGSLVVSSRMSYSFGLFMLLVVCYFSLFGQIPSVLASAAGFCFCIVGGWIRAYRAWQIELQRFAPLSEFTHHPEAWIV